MRDIDHSPQSTGPADEHELRDLCNLFVVVLAFVAAGTGASINFSAIGNAGAALAVLCGVLTLVAAAAVWSMHQRADHEAPRAATENRDSATARRTKHFRLLGSLAFLSVSMGMAGSTLLDLITVFPDRITTAQIIWLVTYSVAVAAAQSQVRIPPRCRCGDQAPLTREIRL